MYWSLCSNFLHQSTLVYEIRGDGLAEEYFKIGSDGSIRINKSLHLDDNKTPTYRVWKIILNFSLEFIIDIECKDSLWKYYTFYIYDWIPLTF